MKGPVPSQDQIKNNGRDQLSIGLSRTLAWEEIGGRIAQSSYSTRAVRFLLWGNHPGLRAMLGYLFSVMPPVVKLWIIGRALKQKLKIWVDAGVASKSIRELSESPKGPTLEEKQLEVVSDRNSSLVLDQSLRDYVSLIHSEDCTRVEPEIRDAVILPRWFSWDWGRRPGDGIGQRVCGNRRSAEWRLLRQHFGSLGRTPLHRWNRHG